MRKESKPKDHSAVMVIRDHKCGADVKAARISIITDEGHLAGVTISRAALESLPDEQRNAFLLQYEGGLSLAEIAQITGVGTETVKKRLNF